jgi:hypothetical protein
MARYVFFSFAYDDVRNFKVNVVRNSWLMNNAENTFVDGSIWEKSKTKGENFLKKLIEDGLKNTSVTAVLIGEDTANRRWVNYEIVKSFERGNGILGIHINRIKGRTGLTARGQNPLERLGFRISEDGQKINFFELKSRSWVEFRDLPQINNKKSNSIYFGNSWWSGNEWGSFFKFSDKFETRCWDFDNGHKNFSDWIIEAAS